MRLGLLIALATVIAASPAHAVFEVFHSTAPDGTAPEVPADVPIGGARTLHLFVDNGSAASPSEPCAGTAPSGDEVCMWDLLIDCDPNLTIAGYTPAGDVVANPQATFIRFNGGDPINGTLGPSDIGMLEITAVGAGDCTVNGEQWVDTGLTAQPAAQGLALASACEDGDGDDVCNASDPCMSYANTDFTDSNGDGIPNECQCGDTGANNGLLQAADAFAIASCVTSPGTCTQDIGLSDTDNNGMFQSADAFNVATQVISGSATAYTLTCARRPEGTPVL